MTSRWSVEKVQENFLKRLDQIEQNIRIIKNNDLMHINARLAKLEEGQNWIKGLLFSIIGVIIASSIGIIMGVRW